MEWDGVLRPTDRMNDRRYERGIRLEPMTYPTFFALGGFVCLFTKKIRLLHLCRHACTCIGYYLQSHNNHISIPQQDRDYISKASSFWLSRDPKSSLTFFYLPPYERVVFARAGMHAPFLYLLYDAFPH